MIYDIVAFVTAGISLAMGSITFIVGLRTRDKTDLVFGVMSLSLFTFFILSPSGFIIADHAPYEADILIKRIFNYSYYALIPWFIAFYVGFRKWTTPVIISAYTVVCYFIMFSEAVDRARPLWSIFSIGVFGSILYYGIRASIKLRKTDKTEAKWLSVTFGVYGILFFLTVLNQLGNSFVARTFGIKLFFPMHFHALFFMLIMGLRVVMRIFDKFKLERTIANRERRWSSLMQSAPVMIVELDVAGNIVSVNQFGLALLGYSDLSSVIHLNWFDNFLLSSEADQRRTQYNEMLEKKYVDPYSNVTIRKLDGSYTHLHWVNFINYDDQNKIVGITSIGRDLTIEDSANRLITQLKDQLEKELIDVSSVSSNDLNVDFIGSSKAAQYALQKAKQVATTNAAVLIQGETGVGKDLLAEYIYKNSSRKTFPFVKVNCGALPKELIEDELFGHEKGAFTSAVQSRKGRFELADGGTIFLDEIGELPLEMQPKLLRVLQNGEFERLGGQKTLKVDVRIIAATNRDLSAEIQHGRFRSDLFYRLNVFPITIPALRHRKEDLLPLINYLISQECKKYGKEVDGISKADLHKLMDYPWPGNIRELKNVIERSIISAAGSTIRLDWFLSNSNDDDSHIHSLEEVDRLHIVRVLEECHWRINGADGAAEILHMHPNTLRSKMKKLGIFRPHDRTSASMFVL